MKNFGILLPIFSLPNNYGIGDFGAEAYKFIDILKENEIEYWEVLPINPIDSNNSPYSPISSLAIEPNFISIDHLKEIGLLKRAYKIECEEKIDYNLVKKTKDKFLRKAYKNFTKENKLYNEYRKYIKNCNTEYAKFMALKKSNKCGWLKFTKSYDEEEYSYQLFLQFIAQYEWFKLKKYANENGVKIIGDIPIYSNYESSDVYFNQNDFILCNGKMSYVSGACPDEVDVYGQKWNQPVYSFDNQKLNNYKLFMEKYLYTDKLFDLIRIDHFRAFDNFYVVPVNGKPKDGIWLQGPGQSFFDKLFTKISSEKFVVEDIGKLRKQTVELREKYNLPGAKIFEYTFNFKTGQDEYINTSNEIVYPGNHDNNTILGWYNSLNEKEKETLNKFLENYKGTINQKIIKYLNEEPHKYLIVMLQDILEQDAKSRINLPGKNENQWKYRLTDISEVNQKLKYIMYTL